MAKAIITLTGEPFKRTLTLLARFNRPSTNLDLIENKFKTFSEDYSQLTKTFSRKEYRNIVVEDLGLPEASLIRRPRMELYSTLAHRARVFLYCKLELAQGEVHPTRKLYIIGSRPLVMVISCAIKYLHECSERYIRQKCSKNTRKAAEAEFTHRVLELCFKEDKRYNIKEGKFYLKMVKRFILENLNLPYPIRTLTQEPNQHWLKKVKLKKPRFKDKYLI